MRILVLGIEWPDFEGFDMVCGVQKSFYSDFWMNWYEKR